MDMKKLQWNMNQAVIKTALVTLFIFLIGCSLPGPGLRESDQITAGSSDSIPRGLVEWCNTLDTDTFYTEPECMWYCRNYSKSEYKKHQMKSKAKAEITTCELR